MGWFMLANIFSALLALIRISFSSDPEKDLEILIVRQQMNLLRRKQDQTVKPDRVDKMILSVLAARWKLISGQSTTRLRRSIRIFQVETVLGWHGELVRRKWRCRPRKNKGGRAHIDHDLESLILHLAKENPR